MRVSKTIKTKSESLKGDFKRGYKQGIDYVEEGWEIPTLSQRMIQDLKDGYFNIDHFDGYVAFVRDFTRLDTRGE